MVQKSIVLVVPPPQGGSTKDDLRGEPAEKRV